MLESGFFGIDVLWGVKVWQVSLSLVLLIISFLAKPITRVVFGRWLQDKTAKTAIQWDDDLVELAPQPVSVALRLIIWYLAAIVLSLPQAPSNVRLWVLTGVEFALWIAVIYVLFSLIDVLSRVLERAAARTETVLDDQLAPLVSKGLKVLVAAIFVVMFIQNMGIEVGSLLASLGIGGLALALAAKDTVANYFGSLIIFVDQPFQIGEVIEIDGMTGVVEEVRFRSTLIRKFDKALVTVPNQTFTNSQITNFSKRPRRRIRLNVGLTYDTTPEQMRDFLEGVKDVLAKHDGIEDDTSAVVFDEFGDSSLNVLVNCYSNNNQWAEMMAAKEQLMLSIMDLVEEMGLGIAFPTRTLHLINEEEKARDGSEGRPQKSEGGGPKSERRWKRGDGKSDDSDADDEE
ncbi:MAG: mechanosensitive ion channel family protein [Rhodothermia bacterium]